MSRFDTLSLTFDTEPLPIVDRSRLWAATAHETGRTVWTARPGYELALGSGLNGIRDDGDTVAVRLSAKFLGPAYFDGFTYANAGHVADLLNASGFFHGVRVDDLLAARVTEAHPFLDLPLGDDLPGYVEAMHLLTATGGKAFRSKGRRKTPTFYAEQPGDGFAVRQYGKAADFGKGKKGHREWRIAQPAVVERAEREGLWRVEGYPTGLAQLRRLAWMDKGTPTASDVLRSPGTPLADALDASLERWEARTLRPMPLPSIPNSPAAAVEAFANLSAREIKDALYARWVCDLADGDLDAAQGVLRSLHGSHNWKRYLPPVEAEIRRRAAVEAVRRAPSLAVDDASPLASVRSILSRVTGSVRQLERAA